jgi:Leucine-rich repeat (LRR) protein
MLRNTTILISFFIFIIINGCSTDSETEIVSTDPSCTQIVTIPDANFKNKLINGGFGIGVTLAGSIVLDANGDGEIQVCEAENIVSLSIDQAEINSIEGILSFRNIQNISFKYNNISAPLDLSSLTRLISIQLTGNNIPSLKVNGLNRLEYLDCNNNNLQTLNLSSLGSLKTVLCGFNQITSLNLENTKKVIDLRVEHNNLPQLNVSQLSDLKFLYANDNNLTALNISGLTNILIVNCSANQIQTLNATNCSSLSDLECNQNNINNLMLSGCTSLGLLKCSLNNLTTLNFNGLSNIYFIDCSGNQFTTLDVRGCTLLNLMDVSFNPNLQTLIIKNGSVAPQGVNIFQCPSLATICCDPAEQNEITLSVQAFGYNCNVITNCF